MEKKEGNSAIVEIYQEYVVKKPRNIKDTENFINTQMRGGDIAKRVADILKEKNIHINLPTILEKTERTIKETRVPGKQFDITTYNSLDTETKEKLANDLANFLVVMHKNITTPERVAMKRTDGNKQLLNGKDILKIDINRLFTKDKELGETSLQNKIDRILNASDDKNIQNLIRDAISYIQNHDDDADNIKATRHHDLRDANMFYDQKTNSLGIIDFEGAIEPGLVYEDFVGSPPSLSWDFEQKLIKRYNALSKQEGLGITINPEKIKNWLIYKTAWVAFRNNWKPEQITEKLKQIGLITSDKTNVKVFKNAVQKINFNDGKNAIQKTPKKMDFVHGIYNSSEKK